jgi:hypothetical protein
MVASTVVPGHTGAVGYLPSRKLAIAVITTYQPGAFDSQGNLTDAGPAIISTLSKALAPPLPFRRSPALPITQRRAQSEGHSRSAEGAFDTRAFPA